MTIDLAMLTASAVLTGCLVLPYGFAMWTQWRIVDAQLAGAVDDDPTGPRGAGAGAGDLHDSPPLHQNRSAGKHARRVHRHDGHVPDGEHGVAGLLCGQAQDGKESQDHVPVR